MTRIGRSNSFPNFAQENNGLTSHTHSRNWKANNGEKKKNSNHLISWSSSSKKLADANKFYSVESLLTDNDFECINGTNTLNIKATKKNYAYIPFLHLNKILNLRSLNEDRIYNGKLPITVVLKDQEEKEKFNEIVTQANFDKLSKKILLTNIVSNLKNMTPEDSLRISGHGLAGNAHVWSDPYIADNSETSNNVEQYHHMHAQNLAEILHNNLGLPDFGKIKLYLCHGAAQKEVSIKINTKENMISNILEQMGDFSKSFAGNLETNLRKIQKKRESGLVYGLPGVVYSSNGLKIDYKDAHVNVHDKHISISKNIIINISNNRIFATFSRFYIHDCPTRLIFINNDLKINSTDDSRKKAASILTEAVIRTEATAVANKKLLIQGVEQWLKLLDKQLPEELTPEKKNKIMHKVGLCAEHHFGAPFDFHELELNSDEISIILNTCPNIIKSKLKFLNLSYNNIAESLDLSDFTRLEVLLLNNNKLEKIFKLPPKISFLSMSNNNIAIEETDHEQQELLRTYVSSFKGTGINLSGNKLNKIPEDIFECFMKGGLRVFNLRRNTLAQETCNSIEKVIRIHSNNKSITFKDNDDE